MPARLDRGGSLGGLRRGAAFGAPGGVNDSLILSETISNANGISPIPTANPVTVVSLTFPISQPSQHVYAIFDTEIDSEAAPGGNSVTFTMRSDGFIISTRTVTVVGSVDDTMAFHELLASYSAGSHTIDVQAQATVGDYAIPAGRNRLTIIVLPG